MGEPCTPSCKTRCTDCWAAPETPSVALSEAEQEALTGAMHYARTYWKFGTEAETQAALFTLAATVDRLAARAEDRRRVEAEALRAAADDLDDHTDCDCEEGWHLSRMVGPGWLRNRADRLDPRSVDEPEA